MRGKIIDVKKDRGFGFVDDGSSNGLFFHISSFSGDVTIEDLNIGDIMEFEVQKSGKGRINAVNCKKIGGLRDYLIDNALTAPSRAEGYDEFCDNVKEYALILKNADVTTSMIRKIYSRILAAENVMELKMLRPQFAYTAGRNEKNSTLKEFMEMLDEIVKSMEVEENPEEIKNFKQFIEAIVAYRKYVGGDK